MCSILLTLCLFATIIWAPIAFVGIIGHCIGLGADLGIIIYTGLIIYSDNSKDCSESNLPITDDKTFADNWEWLDALFISQCVIFTFYSIGIVMAMKFSWNTYESKN